VIQQQKKTRDVRNRFFFISVRLRFFEKVESVQNEFGSVRFRKMRFGLDIIVIYYSCNSGVVNLQQILQ